MFLEHFVLIIYCGGKISILKLFGTKFTPSLQQVQEILALFSPSGRCADILNNLEYLNVDHSKQLEKTSREGEVFKQLERRLQEKEKHSKEIRKLDTNFLD